MNKLTIIILASSAALLFAISTNSYSEESGVSGRATAVDKADQKKHPMGISSTTNKEEAGEKKADRIEDKADKVRDATDY